MRSVWRGNSSSRKLGAERRNHTMRLTNVRRIKLSLGCKFLKLQLAKREHSNLKLFCKNRKIDTEEIDKSISYDENLEHLESISLRTDKELEEYSKIYELQDKETSITEKYGVKDIFSYLDKTQTVKIKAVYLYKFINAHDKQQVKATKTRTEIINNRLNPCLHCPYINCEQRIKLTVKEHVIKAYATVSMIYVLQTKLDEDQNIIYRNIKLKVIAGNREYINGLGWISKEDVAKGNLEPLIIKPVNTSRLKKTPIQLIL